MNCCLLNSSRLKPTFVISLACLSVVIFPGQLLAQTNSKKLRDEISFSNDIQPIVENFCTTCHAGKDPDGEVLLTSYAEVRKLVEKGDLLNRINDSDDPMPPSGKIPAYMRRMFKTWAETGFINKGKKKSEKPAVDYGDFKPPVITPVDLGDNTIAFQLLEKMQGHLLIFAPSKNRTFMESSKAERSATCSHRSLSPTTKESGRSWPAMAGSLMEFTERVISYWIWPKNEKTNGDAKKHTTAWSTPTVAKKSCIWN